jgi:hypothetical protein
LLAVQEFNAAHALRKIEHHAFLENKRIFRRAQWIKQIHLLHVLDHPRRFNATKQAGARLHENPYL